MKTILTTYCKRFNYCCYHHQCIANCRICHTKTLLNLQCTDDDTRSYRNVCNMSLISFSLAVMFIIRFGAVLTKSSILLAHFASRNPTYAATILFLATLANSRCMHSVARRRRKDTLVIPSATTQSLVVKRPNSANTLTIQ